MSTSQLTEQHVRKIALSARLELSDQEVQRLQKQLSHVLDYMSLLGEVDTTGVEPTAQTTGLKNQLRADEPKPSLSQTQALSQAQRTQKGYIAVPAVL